MIPLSIMYKASQLVAAHKQRGSTLIVALVMLVLLTLLAVSAMNATTTSIQVVGNTQFRAEANAAAQQAVEKIISSDFTAFPAASSVVVTIGPATYTAQVAVPTCINSTSVTYGDLDPANPDDEKDCRDSAAKSPNLVLDASGVPISTTLTSCMKQNWDISASVNDTNTGANTTVHQGIFTWAPVGTACP